MAGKITEYPSVISPWPSPNDYYDVSQIVAIILFPPTVFYQSRKMTWTQLVAAMSDELPPVDLDAVLANGNLTNEQSILSNNSKSRLDLFNDDTYIGYSDAGIESNITMAPLSMFIHYSDGATGGSAFIDNASFVINHDILIKNNSPAWNWNDTITAQGNMDSSNFNYQTGTGGKINISDSIARITIDDGIAKYISVLAEQIKLTHDAFIYASSPNLFFETATGGALNISDASTYITNDGGTNNFFAIDGTASYISHDTNINVKSPNITASRVPYIDSAKNIVTSSITPTELGYLTGGTSPFQAQIDALVSGLSWKQNVRAATTVNGTLATAFQNGSVIDGVTLATGDRILLKNQTTATENGVYTVNVSGSPTRSLDMNSGSEFPDATLFVAEGTVNADIQFLCTNNSVSIGITNIVFIQIGNSIYVGTTNRLSLTGNVFDIDAAYIGQASITTVGTLVSGSIGSGFTAIANSALANSTITVNGSSTALGGSVIITVTGTTNRITVTGGTGLTPTLDISATFEALLGKVANPLSQFAATTSAQLASIISDETGSGPLVFATSPTITGASLGSTSTAATQSPSDNSTKLATTAYVDAAVLGQNFKEATKYGTTAALPAIVYNNGSSGVGATLTAVSFGAITFDGSTPSVGDRVLIKNQVTTFQNGIYTVTTVGGVATLFVLTRATDFNQSFEIKTGDSVFITSGTSLGTTTWAYNGTDNPVMGTDAISFSQTAGQGSFTAGTGIVITGLSIAIDSTVATLAGSQTFTNKTITAPDINLGTVDSLSSLSVRDTSAVQDVTFAATSSITLTGNRTITFDTRDQSSTVTLGTWITFSSTITGFSGTPTQTCTYAVIGKNVFCKMIITGTSNSTGFTITLPVAALDRVRVVCHVQNNGVRTNGGIVRTTAANAACDVFATASEGNFTNSGTKSLELYFNYESQ